MTNQMILQKFRRQYEEFFLPVGILLVVMLLCFVIVIPAGRQAFAKFETVATLRAEVDVLTKKRAILEQADVSGLEKNVSIVSSFLPVEKSFPSVFQTLEYLAADTNGTVSSINLVSPGNIASESGVVQSASAIDKKLGVFVLPFVATIKTTYEDFSRFLVKTANVRRYIRIKAFTLKTTEGVLLDAEISGEAYYLPVRGGLGQNAIIELLRPEEEEQIAQIGQFPDGSGLSSVTQTPVILPSTPAKINPFLP